MNTVSTKPGNYVNIPAWSEIDEEARRKVYGAVWSVVWAEDIEDACYAALAKLGFHTSEKTWEDFRPDMIEAIYSELIDQTEKWEQESQKARSRGLFARATKADSFRVAFLSALEALGYTPPAYRYH